MTSRRSFLTGLGAALVAAPAVVRAGSLMPVRALDPVKPMLTSAEIRRIAEMWRRMQYAEKEMMQLFAATGRYMNGAQWTAREVELAEAQGRRNLQRTLSALRSTAFPPSPA